jgi:hypothetical protein
VTPFEADEYHKQQKLGDSEHDDSPCACCCLSCPDPVIEAARQWVEYP